MTNLIEIYRETIVSSARTIDGQLGLTNDGLYNLLGEIEKEQRGTSEVRELFNSWFENHLSKIENSDRELFNSLKKKMMSSVLDFADLVFRSYMVSDEVIEQLGGIQTTDKSHYWFFTFNADSFIFSYRDELYRCYDNNGDAIIECIGVGAQADKSIFRTSIRNREYDIIVNIDHIKCSNLSCRHNPENGGLCNSYKISNNGCMDGVSPVEIMQIAKFVMLNHENL